MLGIVRRISSNTAETGSSRHGRPMRWAIFWMIHRSWRASPGGSIAWRPICTRRSVLVKVPVFSGKALAGRITSAR